MANWKTECNKTLCINNNQQNPVILTLSTFNSRTFTCSIKISSDTTMNVHQYFMVYTQNNMHEKKW